MTRSSLLAAIGGDPLTAEGLKGKPGFKAVEEIAPGMRAQGMGRSAIAVRVPPSLSRTRPAPSR